MHKGNCKKLIYLLFAVRTHFSVQVVFRLENGNYTIEDLMAEIKTETEVL